MTRSSRGKCRYTDHCKKARTATGLSLFLPIVIILIIVSVIFDILAVTNNVGFVMNDARVSYAFYPEVIAIGFFGFSSLFLFEEKILREICFFSSILFSLILYEELVMGGAI